MAASNPQAFYNLWQADAIRERLFELLSKKDICAIRLANSACCNLVTKRLFLRTTLTFTANSFTRPSRIDALSRVGHHIEHLTFYFPHSNATFLPPLVHPRTGEEISFLYNPVTSLESSLTRPKYANDELAEILTQQYSPLFHAATHVPSFISAFSQLPNLRHLTVRTPGQDPSERYRRDIVDYALISLRIAVERAPLTKLSKLSLSGVHPSALHYLRHAPGGGMGTLPSAAQRWRQIRKLYISIEAWDFYGPCPGLDQLKIIDDFIRAFAAGLEKFSFSWLGRRGPCPLALANDPLFAPPRSSRKLFAEVTSPMSPLPVRPPRAMIVMPKLRYMCVKNATMNVEQLRGLVAAHKGTVREFDFDNVALIKGGSWDEALAPLTEGGKVECEGSPMAKEVWSRRSVLSIDDRPLTSKSNSASLVSSSEDEEIPTPSAAAQAASRELFEVDVIEGMLFGGLNDVEKFEQDVEAWAREVTAAAAAAAAAKPKTPEKKAAEVDDGGLASDIEAARLASESFTTKLKKRRVRKKRSNEGEQKPESGTITEQKEVREEPKSGHHGKEPRHHHRSHHKHSRSDDTSDRISRRHHRRHRRHCSEDTTASVPVALEISVPEKLPTPNASPKHTVTPHFSPSKHRPTTPELTPPAPEDERISIPILSPDALPVLLQPTVYDPSAPGKHRHRNPVLPPTPEESPSAASIPEDEKNEAAARASALQRAKEAVMTKLSKEYTHRAKEKQESEWTASAAVQASLSALNLGVKTSAESGSFLSGDLDWEKYGHGLTHTGSSGSIGSRLKEGLFGRSLASVAAAAAVCHHGNSWVSDVRGSVESQSALVPLIFSRS
ncbi:uncharacterized protein CTHT_0050910 [Thermochaetoides thermophila DSM 1495]|uniref:Uncharacterized protein n=1 Tax=Chaetomium thermophilum (strain DSM 1495 / CBS 144.50 / IMI 039719) TaxID=759272 RepID=G0SD88_CHATD|nr:hypothetical protein CTHT_0050910 [Thermochaetoides thermophila DSM 1495]EGS18489.1 hypothetical protein CTHT_0050910 [Thermochaetoides thermophila DSM 1495]